MSKDEIGALLKERRDCHNLRQKDLSEMSGVTSRTIYLIENGKGNPSLETLLKLADVLGMELILRVKKTN